MRSPGWRWRWRRMPNGCSSSPVRATTAATASKPRPACAPSARTPPSCSSAIPPPCPPTPPAPTPARARRAFRSRPGRRHRATRPGWSSTPCSASAARGRPAATWPRRSASSPAFAGRGVPVLAVDVPSGLDPERGQPLGDACIVAQHTLALIGARPGLFTASGRDFAGTVWTDALGLDLDRARAGRLAGRRRRDRPPRAAAPPRRAQGQLRRRRHRRRRRRHGRRGAARRPGRACRGRRPGLRRPARRRRGALALDPERPELMLRPGWWQGAAAAVELSTVVCGCGGGDAVRAALPRLVGLASRLVLDADALNAVAIDTALRTVLAARAGRDRGDDPDAASARGGAPARHDDAGGPGRSPRRGDRAGRALPRHGRPQGLGQHHRRRPGKRRGSAPPATPRSPPRAPATCSPAGSAAAGARARRPSTSPRSPSSSTAPRPSRRRPARCAPRDLIERLYRRGRDG